MAELIQLDLISLLYTSISLSMAFILGGAIGIERQIRQRTAGLRTNVLVCLGAALFVDIAMRFYAIHGGTPSPLHVVAYVVSGVGFLGAGVIMREEGNIRGINTAATLWGSAAVGCACGTHFFIEAILGAIFVLAANTLLRPIANRINQQPLNFELLEELYTLYIIAEKNNQEAVLLFLEQIFIKARIPLDQINVNQFGTTEIEIKITIFFTTIDQHKLDALINKIKQNELIIQVIGNLNHIE